MDNLAFATAREANDGQAQAAPSPSAMVIETPFVSMKRIENCLLQLDGVTDASTWLDGRFIRAHATLDEGAIWQEASLMGEIDRRLGQQNRPASITLILEKAGRAVVPMAA